MEVRVREELKSLLYECSKISESWRRKLAIASIITRVFEENGKYPPVLVGGMVVATYSSGLYATEDIDFMSPYADFPYKALEAMGYVRVGKDCFHMGINSYVEFPSGKFSGSEERVLKYDIEETGLPVYVTSVEDIILDRLDSFVATGDKKSKEWVLRLMSGLYPSIDWSYLHKESHKRGNLKVLEQLQRKVKGYNKLYRDMMDESTVTKTSGHMNLFD